MEGRSVRKNDFHTNKIIAFIFLYFYCLFYKQRKAAAVCRFVHATSLLPYDFLCINKHTLSMVLPMGPCFQ